MLIAAVRSVATYLAVSLYVLVTAPLGMLIGVLTGWTDILYVFGHGGVRLALWLSGIHCEVEGAEHLPRDRAAVFCANHQSNVDPPLLFVVLHPRLHIVYKHEIDAIPLLARAFRMGGFIPIDRRSREAAMRSIDAGARSIRAGHSFLIFPEGTRSRTNALLPFKKGGFAMALKGGAPIVPVAIQGGRAAMVKGSWLIRPARVTIRIGAPIETSAYQPNGREALVTRVREAIEGLLVDRSA